LEQSHKTELASQTRLAELWERSCRETQERNRDLEVQLEREQDEIVAEAAKWQAKFSGEESRLLEAEDKIRSLNEEIERLEAVIENNASALVPLNGRGPLTPGPYSPSQGSVFSPSAQAIEKRGRGGMSLTQLYSELHAAKQGETIQRRRAEKLQEEFEQYREEAERWAPEYQTMIQEFELQKEDLAIMSVNLQNAVSEKEEAERQFKLMKNGMMDKERETRLYQQRGYPDDCADGRFSWSGETSSTSLERVAGTRIGIVWGLECRRNTSNARNERGIRSES